jgi:hypothetical protein
MSKLRLRRPSPALVIAVLALFVGLGGGAYAAGEIGTKDLKKNAVTKSKIKNKAVSGSKIAAGAVKTNKVASGAVTSSKLANPSYWAYVSGGGSASLSRGNGALSATNVGVGHFKVTFETSVAGCSYQVSPTHQTAGREAAADLDTDDNTRVSVKIRTSGGSLTNSGSKFSLAVNC